MAKPRAERPATRRRCALPGCAAVRYEQGLCRSHFQRAAALGEPSTAGARKVLLAADRAHSAASAVAEKRARNADRLVGCALERWLAGRRAQKAIGARLFRCCHCVCHDGVGSWQTHRAP